MFGDSGYLVDLVETALAYGAELVEEFLALFPDTGLDKVNEDARADLIDFATRGLRGVVEDAEREWWASEHVAGPAQLINETVDELHDGDPEAAELKAELVPSERRSAIIYMQMVLLFFF